ncbi:hypothetical protein M8360_32650, partial [Klebsiella pneumoniae]|nr:hypothetical protein [Klebsiella pneumoniae]
VLISSSTINIFIMLPGWLLMSFYCSHDRYQRITAKMTTLSLSCHPANRERSVKYPYQYSGLRLNHLPGLPVREALCSN